MSEAGPEQPGGATYSPTASLRRGHVSTPVALGLTVLGTLIPGAGLIAAGRRRLGLAVLGMFVGFCAVVAYLVLAGQRTLLHWSVEPEALLLLGIGLPTLGAAWCLLIVLTYRSLQPRAYRSWHQVASRLVVGIMAFAVLAPFAVAGRYALVQKSVIDHVFSAPETVTRNPAGVGTLATSRGRTNASNAPAASAATNTSTVTADPWEGRDRINVLLLGGDAGPDRHGTRTDTIILASIDTHTGNTVLFSIPRNLQKAPFPPGSALAKAYPNGFHAPGDVNEQLITEVYENVPAAHPNLIQAPDPGAVAVKEAVSGVLGLPLDYYVLVNLKGFEELIDALGGLTLDVNERVAIGGEADAGLKPHSYIEKGPAQHMDGWTALWFARGRYGASDWDRMLRQRCVIKAIIDQANPVTLLTRYEAIAQTSKDVLQSDIPAEKLPAFVDLALKVKDADVTNIAFLLSVIRPSHPNFTLMRTMVQQALTASTRKGAPAPAHLDTLANVCAYRKS